MKKLLVIAAALLLGMQANAQLIFNGGYLHQTEQTVITENGVNINGTDLQDGFYAGAKYRINLDGITEGLSLNPGANVSFLFGRHNSIDFKDVFDDHAVMNQIAFNAPLHVQYLFEVSPDFKLEAWAGPTFQLGLYDRVIDTDDNPTYIFNRFKAVTLAARPLAPLNRINLLLGLGLGVEVSELIHINVGYDFGLFNLSTATNTKITRGLLRVGFGYNF